MLLLELLLIIIRIFQGKLSNQDEIKIKYLDDEKDKITLTNDDDLKLALYFKRQLHLFVSNNKVSTEKGKETAIKKSANMIEGELFRDELRQIRNSVQTILDTLPLVNQTTREDSTTNKIVSQSKTVPNVSPIVTQEFDPVTTNQNRNNESTSSTKSQQGNFFSDQDCPNRMSFKKLFNFSS